MKRYIKTHKEPRYATNVSFNFEHSGDYNKPEIEEGIKRLMKSFGSDIQLDEFIDFSPSVRIER